MYGFSGNHPVLAEIVFWVVSEGFFLTVACIKEKKGKTMAFTLPHNIILLVCVGIVVSIVGFIIYGLVVGFDKTMKNEDED
jgi:hypothetical protein